MVCLVAACTVHVAVTTGHAQGESYVDDDRTIHFFDFDERDDGNLESIPKYWVPFESDDFPNYATGAFNNTVGHDASPSFHLISEGRNVAHRYAGPETVIQPNSDYLVTGWVRGHQLKHARAAISAYYLDDRRLPIESTQKFSRLVGGDDDEWQQVEVYLPAGPSRARTIGLTVWVVQPGVWDVGPQPNRHIAMYDVEAEAYFDDVAVVRLPRVHIDTGAPGNVYTPEIPKAVTARVIDADATRLSARLDIRDIDGFNIRSTPVPVSSQTDIQPASADIGDLPLGGYEAVLVVETDKRILAQRSKRFAIVAEAARREGLRSRSLGVSLSVNDRAAPEVELAMLRLIGAGAVKIPVWSGSAHIPDLMDVGSEYDTLLQGLVRSRMNITGVLAGAPSELIRIAGAYPRSLMTLLSEEPDKWREHLVRVYAPYSSIFRSWQIGQDGDTDVMQDARLKDVIANVRQAVRQLNTQAHLTVPISLNSLPDLTELTADDFCITIDDSIHHGYIGEHVESQRGVGVVTRTAFVPYTQTSHYWLKRELPGWSKRIIEARFAGVESVIVPQPWTTRQSYDEEVTEPNEAFVALHTLVRHVGDAAPGERVRVRPGVTALSFYGLKQATLVIWDDHATENRRRHVIQLGQDAKWVTDMWGRRSKIDVTDDGRQILELSREPMYIENVDPHLLRVRSGVRIEPATVSYSIDIHKHTLVLNNPRNTSISGSVTITPPPRWTIHPANFNFVISPNGKFEKPLEIRFNRDESAGEKTVHVEMELVDTRRQKLVVPVPMKLVNEELDAWAYATVEGDSLVIRHSVTNKSDQSLNLRSSAIVPGKRRQYRNLLAFAPQQTATVEYRLKEWNELKGRRVRLYLREINGTRMHNVEVQVPR